MPKAAIDDMLSMYYEDYDFVDPWRPHDTVVLHHGIGKHHGLWYGWIPVLARSCRVIALDARGFGQSTFPPAGYDWTLENLVSDLNHLLEHLNSSKVHLIGETLGGVVCLQYAIKHVDRVASVTVCTCPYMVERSVLASTSQLARDRGVEAWARQLVGERVDPKYDDPTRVEWYIQQLSGTNGEVLNGILSSLGAIDLRPVLREIEVPSLILKGGRCASTYSKWAEVMHNAIGGSKLVSIPNASAFVDQSASEQCAHAWQRFVRDAR
jgi:pimeloyl-ACP methyl ester carboxylesterase